MDYSSIAKQVRKTALKECLVCGNEIKVIPSLAERKKYCSRKCLYESRKGHIPWNKGKRVTVKKECSTCGNEFSITDWRYNRKFCSQKCVRNKGQENVGKKLEDHYAWKGERAEYSSIHQVLRSVVGSPESCSDCGVKNKLCKDGRSYIQWANVDHTYSRDPDDYIPLCPSCHKIYDQGLRQHS